MFSFLGAFICVEKHSSETASLKSSRRKLNTGYVISTRKCLKRTLTFISYSDLMKTIEILLRAYFIIGLQWFKSEIMKVYILQTAVQVGIACKNAPVLVPRLH